MRPLILMTAAALGATAASTPEVLSNSILEIRLDAQKRGAIASITDRATGSQLALPAHTLFRLTVVDADGKARELTAADAGSFEESLRRTGVADERVLIFRRLAGQKIDVECRIGLGANHRLSRWRAEVRNSSNWTLRSLEFPVLNVPLQLGPDAAGDRLLYPVHHGQLVPAPGANLPAGKRILYGYPGSVAAQFMACYDETAGLYIATYDGNGYPKHFGLLREANAIHLIVEHNIPEEPGRSWSMPYDVVLGPFHGDWHSAADIYKQWAGAQEWCSRKLSQRSDIAGWYLRGLPILMFVPRARETEPLAAPGWRPQAPAIFREASAALRSPVTVVEYAWEKWGSWINPDVFPPYGGDAAFTRQIRELKQDGHLFGCYLSGTRWGLRKPGTSYDGTAAFERLAADAATTDEAQQPVIERRPWADNVRLCIGSARTKRILIDEVRGLAERGVDWVQFDQNLGCEAYVCYNRRHSHPGGFGKWMTDDTRAMLAEARAAGKALNPGFIMTVEEPCEYFIQDLDGYNDRPYVYSGFPLSLPVAEAVPLFSYLYHEYALGFGGDSAIGLKSPLAPFVKLARGMAAGLLVEGPALRPGAEWKAEEREFMARIAEAQQQFAHDYLVLGEMLPPPEIDSVPAEEGDIVTAANAEGRKVRVPVVFASAWRAPSGRLGYVLANVSDTEVRPVLRTSSIGTNQSIYQLVKINREGAAPLRAGADPERIEIPLGAHEIALIEREAIP